MAPGISTLTYLLTKPKPAGPSTAARTAHMCVLITVYNCGTQYSTEQFW